MKNLIIVIEDDRDILDMIQYILADEGYEIMSYDHLIKLESIIAKRPSLILLDERLANGYGSTLCLELKSNPLTKPVPVILVSAAIGLAQIAKNCGADAVLDKPFDLNDLVNLVKRYSLIHSPIIGKKVTAIKKV